MSELARVAGKYTVLGLLGRGGLSEVYRVRDERSGEQLALKRLQPRVGQHRALARAQLEREYHTLAEISHPSVIRVHEYGIDEEGAYYTMELLEGSELLASGRRPWREAGGILRQIAVALALLHQRRLLHRDLSPRNVVRVADGTIKLIDFGAMAPIGLIGALVGTPPMVPPEAVQQQALDERADLYSLGALGYWLLTGRHAYPAHELDELRDLFRSAPLAPSRIVADVPEALSQLLLELLSLDRFSRPGHAAEVIERLDAVLGGAGGDDAREHGRAYLATPKLIGRGRELRAVRARMVEGLRGRGSTLLLEGDAGSGRSRMLDACVLEAKLLGATVLRAGASDAARGDYGVASALAAQLVVELPELGEDVARLRGGLLASVVPGLRGDARSEPPEAHPRRHLQTALRDWMRSIARTRRIVMAVDDVERADEPSLALLAALAHKSERRRLMIVATVERGAPPSAGLTLLQEAATTLPLEPLDALETERLLESIFGTAQNVPALSRRVFELSEGNPREIMALADHLVQRGLARYAAGSWSLPARLQAGDLPASHEAALRARLAGLPPSARALAERMALLCAPRVALDDLAALHDAEERSALFRDLHALLEEGVVRAEGDAHRFARPEWAELLIDGLAPEARRALHLRIAERLGPRLDPLRRAQHLMAGDRPAEATALLIERRSELSAWQSSRSVDLLDQAVKATEALGWPLRTRIPLHTWLLQNSAVTGRLDVFSRLVRPTLERLLEKSGVLDLPQPSASLSPEERLRMALAAAEARDAACVESERLPPEVALRELGRLYGAACTMAASALDAALIEELPPIEPFAPVAPALSFVTALLAATRHHLAGRYRSALAVYRGMLGQTERGSVEERGRTRQRSNTLYAVGMLEAMQGMEQALDRVEALDERPGWRVNAWRVRATYQATIGDFDQARRAERRAQLLLLQDGVQMMPATDHLAEGAARWICDDLEGIKHVLDRFREAGRQFPVRELFRQVAESQYLRVKGEAAHGLEVLQPVLEQTSPDRSVRFTWIGVTHLMLLLALERHEEAVQVGERYAEALRMRGLDGVERSAVLHYLAQALSAHGQRERAIEVCEGALKEATAAGVRGLPLALGYETRARIALHARDREKFTEFFGLAAAECGRAERPSMAAKLGRLAREAERALRERDLGSLVPLSGPAREDTEDGAQGTVISRMAECVDRDERVRCALMVLLEHAHLPEGHLFGWLDGRISHLVSHPRDGVAPEVLERLSQRVEAELDSGDTTDRRGRPGRTAPELLSAPPADARLRVLPIYGVRDGEPVLAAVAALPRGEGLWQRPPAALLAALARSLLDHDDVDAMARLD